MKTITFAPTYDVSLPAEVYSILYDKVQELLIDATTPEECAAALQEAYDSLK